MTILQTGVLFAFFSVVLGAFGAHALKDVFNAHAREMWQTAVHYHMFHALALLLAGLLQLARPQVAMRWPGWCFTAGIILFSGSLYLLALTGKSWLGAVTPFGGLAFLMGWLLFGLALLKSSL